MSGRYDAIVIGCGGLGSAALYWLARCCSGNVMGLEQFELGHERGGSQDHSRIIRLVQHEEIYARLAPHAYAVWHEIEAQSGQTLLTETGGLVIDDPKERRSKQVGRRNVAGYIELLERHGVEYEVLDPGELARRWPQFKLRGSERVLYQKNTGIVDAMRANATHLALARGLGAEIRARATVRCIIPEAHGVTILTDDARLQAKRAVITAGAWSNKLLEPLLGQPLPLTVTQEQVTYYATPHIKAFSIPHFPIFMWHGRENYYGFPVYGEVATKLGQHMGGPVVTAESRDFVPDSKRRAAYTRFLQEHIPDFLGPELYSKTCLYTVPPDQHFVIDHLAKYPQVVVGIGAGHAYKFASLLGRTLAELAADGGSEFCDPTFSLNRPALTDASFPKSFHA